MTALERYARLEAEARFYDGESARGLSVVVGFGERSLVIKDFSDRVIDHWPLASLRAIGERGDRAVQLVPRAESESRLILKDPEMVAAIHKVCPDLYHRAVDGKGLRNAFIYAVAAIAAVLAIIFVLVPNLAGQLALFIPPERERQLGDAVAGQLGDLLEFSTGERPRRCVDEDGIAALEAMIARLDAGGDMPYPLRVSVIDHEMTNAVALPGGRILIFEGLIDSARNPEEVAGVLAHEIAHVIYRDPTVGALRAAGTAGIISLMVGDVFGVGVAVAIGEAAMSAGYQQEAETRADAEATRILTEAGLPTTPFAEFFARLREEHGDTPAALQYFSTHPALDERADKAAAANAVAEGFEPVIDDQSWVALREICSATDPDLKAYR